MVADGDRPTVLSVQKYESGPPVAENGQLISADGDTLAATKQEEWVKKKRVELTTTKQIETRVKRQLVLEDGKVVDDSGPIVTTNTTEDTDKQESERTEHFTHGDDMEGKQGWVPVGGIPEDAVLKETNERKITTHDEVEDIYETEEIKQLGDFSNEEIVRALREEQDLEKGLLTHAEKRQLLPIYKNKETQKRVLQDRRRHDRTTDIEDTKEISRMKDDGNVVTEIIRRHEHEEFHNDDIPDSDSDEYDHIEHRRGAEDYSHTKSENFVDYLTYPKGSNKSGRVKIGEGVLNVSETINIQREGDEDVWDSVSERLRRAVKEDGLGNNKFGVFPQRPNVLTNRPIDINHEERFKRTETNRWLDSHFGSSSSSLSSEVSPRSPIPPAPTGIHVTMTSRNSPKQSSPPPPQIKGKLTSKQKSQGTGKRITFRDTSSRSTPSHTVHFDLKPRYEDGVRSPTGRVSFSKSGSPWDERPTPTPPPRYRRAKSPDGFLQSDQTRYTRHGGIMDSGRGYSDYLQKREDFGERRSYERREQNFGYNGPARHGDAVDRYGDYATKHSNYYKTTETDSPEHNGEAEVERRKTVERREQVFSYDGAPQRQFHPKYILGTPSSTMGRLRGIEHTGAVVDPPTDSRSSQSLPRRRFYFGDDQGSLLGSSTRAIKYGADDINVSISNSYNNDQRRSQSLNRSMSFTPKSVGNEKPSSLYSQRVSPPKHTQVYTSNPQLADAPDLVAPRLLQSMSRSTRDMGSYERSDEYSSTSKSRRNFMDNIKRQTADTYDSKGSSPARSTYSPTNAYSPRGFSPRKSKTLGGSNSPISDDYQETFRMSSSTPDHEEGKPKISTDTTSRFSRKTLRNELGDPAGQIESTDTTTRTKSRYTASEVQYPNGRRVASPTPINVDYPPPRQLNSSGTVVIPVKDPNNNKDRQFKK